MDKIIGRYKKVHNLKHDKDVARRMGLTPTAFSNQKGRGAIDLEKLLDSCDRDVNLHWLLTGEGDQKIRTAGDVDQELQNYESEVSDLQISDIDQDDLLEFLLSQQESVLNFLRKMKGEGDD